LMHCDIVGSRIYNYTNSQLFHQGIVGKLKKNHS